jgi:hypothetical protein
LVRRVRTGARTNTKTYTNNRTRDGGVLLSNGGEQPDARR